MSDVKCPYCGHDQEINHDDGYGYSEGIEHSQDCVECGMEFKFTISFYVSYEVFCSDNHDLEQSPVAGHENFFSCSRCDYTEIRKGKAQ